MPELWARVVGFPAYEISTNGRVRQFHTRKMIATTPNRDGYLYSRLQRARLWYFKRVHILVYKTFKGPTRGLTVDHEDRNRGNPRLVNLRLANGTQQQAHARRRGLGKSRYRGVTWQKSRGRWFCSIRIYRRTRFLGRFDSERAAAMAYDVAALALFGEFADLNFK